MVLSAHIIAGAAIGVSFNNLWLSMPAALLSHYLLDIVPHREYSIKNLERGKFDQGFRHDLLKVTVDLTLGFSLVALATNSSMGALVGGFLGAAPDASTFLVFLLLKDKNKSLSLFAKLLKGHLTLHRKIQIWGSPKVPWRLAIFTQATVILSGLFILLY